MNQETDISQLLIKNSTTAVLREQRVRWTGDVIGLMGVVILIAAAVISAGILARTFTFLETIPIYILLALIVPAWLAVRSGRWKWAGYLPVGLCFGLGIYSSLNVGFVTIFVLYYALAVLLAGMLIDSRMGFWMVVSSSLAYTGFGLLHESNQLTGMVEALPSIITFVAGLTGVALLQWYTYSRLEKILAAQIAGNELLKREIARREQAETTQREQEDQLRRLAENTTDLVTEVDSQGTMLYVSPSYRQGLGYEPDLVIGKNAFDLVHPEDRQLAIETAAQVGAEHRSGKVTLRVRHADGHYLSLEVSGNPLYDPGGALSGFVLSSRDITSEKEAQNKLLESESKFRNIIESLPLGIHLYTLLEDGGLIFDGYNHAADAILGIDHTEILNQPIESAFPGLIGTHIPARYRDIARSGGRWREERLNYSSGAIHGAFEVNAFQVSPGKIAAIFDDITQRIRAADALQLSEEKFATAFLTSPDAVNINRLSDGVYLDINQGFTKLMGYEREEVLGVSSLELNIWDDPKDRARLVKGLLESGEVRNLEAGFRRKNGEVAIALMSARVIDIGGEKCILSITREITERIKAELELREAHARLEQAYEATLQGWARALELRERETADHSRRIVDLTLLIAEKLGIQGEELVHIRRGALLHDIGKMGVPDEILLKPGRLTPDEWVTMRQHTEFARAMLSGIDYLGSSMAIPFSHHEKWDGSGYPEGLKGEEIPLPARIFAVVDVFDALTHYRPYKPAWSAAEAKRYLVEQKGIHFDPAIVDVFLEVIEP